MSAGLIEIHYKVTPVDIVEIPSRLNCMSACGKRIPS